jgi:hypothetical protein
MTISCTYNFNKKGYSFKYVFVTFFKMREYTFTCC